MKILEKIRAGLREKDSLLYFKYLSKINTQFASEEPRNKRQH
jgi:hypothetical protein